MSQTFNCSHHKGPLDKYGPKNSGNPYYRVPKVKHNGSSVILRGCRAISPVYKLVNCDGTVKSATYQVLLSDYLLLSAVKLFHTQEI